LSLLLLDTTFLIDAEHDVDSVDDLIADDDDTAIARVTVAELLVGVWLATGRRRAARQAFADAVVSAIPTITYDIRVAWAHAQLLTAAHQSGRPRGAHDLIIAATAIASGRTVVTADPTGFEGLPGVELIRHR
jgi:tRNA(fMet)-specific endonuclease VapC